MKKIFLPILLFVAARSFSQMPELKDRTQRFMFESFKKNYPSDIKQAKVTTESIYLFLPEDDLHKTDSSLDAIITYDQQGQIINVKQFVGKSVISKTYRYFYNDSGNLYKKLITTSNGNNYIHFTEIEYNGSGLETVKYDYDKDSANMQILIKQYNEQSQLIAIQFMAQNGEMKTAKEFFYTDKNNFLC